MKNKPQLRSNDHTEENNINANNSVQIVEPTINNESAIEEIISAAEEQPIDLNTVTPTDNTALTVKSEDIKLYFRNQMSNSYKMTEKELQKIIYSNVEHRNPLNRINLLIYYKNKKLKNLFIRNNNNKSTSDFNVVYRYDCDQAQCKIAHACYIGHTTTTVKERMKQHSSIKRHHKEVHQTNITGTKMLENVTVMTKLHNKRDLIIMEALLIKQHKPIINIQTDDFNRTLKVF